MQIAIQISNPDRQCRWTREQAKETGGSRAARRQTSAAVAANISYAHADNDDDGASLRTQAHTKTYIRPLYTWWRFESYLRSVRVVSLWTSDISRSCCCLNAHFGRAWCKQWRKTPSGRVQSQDARVATSSYEAEPVHPFNPERIKHRTLQAIDEWNMSHRCRSPCAGCSDATRVCPAYSFHQDAALKVTICSTNEACSEDGETREDG